MGEIADMILDGALCEGCQIYIGEPAGYPRRCPACRKTQRNDALRTATHAHYRAEKMPCPVCNKRVKIAGIADHMREVHGRMSDAHTTDSR